MNSRKNYGEDENDNVINFDGSLEYHSTAFWKKGTETDRWCNFLESTERVLLDCKNGSCRIAGKIGVIPPKYDSCFCRVPFDRAYDDECEYCQHEDSDTQACFRKVNVAVDIGNNTKVIVEFKNVIYVGISWDDDAHMKINLVREPWIVKLDALIDDFIVTTNK